MLSKQELQSIQQALANNPTRNAKRKLKDKLTEHKYASKYQQFKPLSHTRHFINRKTDEKTLKEVIDIAKKSEIILLDTEMVPVYRQPNRPGLIQLELIPADTIPTVIIIEVNHLPPTDSEIFKQMKEIFRIVLDSNKIFYTWGTIKELEPFVQFGLFENFQIDLPDDENLQSHFKKYWQDCYPHKSTNDCRCEICIGKDSDQPWKLIDAVGHQLEEWLDKRCTCSKFDIGLDSELGKFSREQIEYRRTLTEYAANDVLAMEKLMIEMQERPPPPPPPTKQTISHQKHIGEIHNEPSTDTMKEIPIVLLLHPASPLIDTQSRIVFDEQSNERIGEKINRKKVEHQRDETSHQEAQQQVNHYDSDEQQQINYCYSGAQHQTNRQHPQEDDTEAERKRKNRIRTIKQRQRNYRKEIIRRNIDPRWSITLVKEVLRRYEVPHAAVNIAKSKITGRSSLYIGIRDPTNIREYEHRTRSLFTKEHYDEFHGRHRFRRY